MYSVIELKPFDETDWYGWSGAEMPDQYTQPMIGYTEVTQWPESMAIDDDVTVVVDGVGVGFYGQEHNLFLQCTFELGRLIVRSFEEPPNYYQLLNLGFKPC